MRGFKVIVAHPGKQHSYRLATALKKNNMLFKYVTTVYDKKTSSWMKVVKKFLINDNLKRASSRKCEALNDNEVTQFYEFYGLLTLLILRIDKTGNVYRRLSSYVSDLFGRKVARYAIKNNVDAVVMYDTNANKCFKILKKKAPHIKRIMDVSAANRIYMKKVYEEDMRLNKEYSSMLYNERNFLWGGKMTSLYEELEYTNYYLVPSNFVKTSLEYSGIKNELIRVCPYGTNFQQKNNKNYKSNKDLKLVYVGNVTQMKGLSYLLEAISMYDPKEVSLTVVGNYDKDNIMVNKYKHVITFTGRILHNEVEEILKKSDVFILPSLGEGMSLAGIEAMSSGLPIICTTNSGINDLVIDGKNGFIIPISDVKAIIEKVDFFLLNRNKIKEMGVEAKKTVSKYTWEAYENKIIKSIKDIFYEENNYGLYQ